MPRLPLPLCATALAVILLAGCGTSPPARYYHLQPLALEAGKAVETKRLGVGPLSLPQYLDRPQIVTLVDTAQISIDDYSLWAEPLEAAVPWIIAVNLSGLTESVAAVHHKQSGFLPFEYRLVGNVLQFDADAGGRVQLVVQWWLQDAEGNSLIPRTTGRYQGQAGEPGSVSSVVQAMNDLLLVFSKDIATALDERL